MTTVLGEVVSLRGPDARAYLQGQVSQDLEVLETGGHARTLLLDPAGTLVAVGTVRIDAPDDVVLEVPAGVSDAARARLERFAIRADVTFAAGSGDPTDTALGDDLARIDEGIPGVHELARGLVAHSLIADLVAQCVSFTKGCYPGQELVARMHARGATPPYVLRRIHCGAPVEVDAAAGDPSFEGRVTSVVGSSDGQWHALCVLHRRDGSSGEIDVHTASGIVRASIR